MPQGGSQIVSALAQKVGEKRNTVSIYLILTLCISIQVQSRDHKGKMNQWFRQTHLLPVQGEIIWIHIRGAEAGSGFGRRDGLPMSPESQI